MTLIPLDLALAERIWRNASERLPLPTSGPAWLAIADVVGMVLHTHPVARALAAELDGCELPVFDAEALLFEVADWIEGFHPGADMKALLAAGRSGLDLAKGRVRKSDGRESAGTTWKLVVWSMYLKRLDPPSLQEAGKDPVMRSILEGIGAAAMLFGQPVDDGAESAEGRLTEVMRVILLKMLIEQRGIPVDTLRRKGEGPPWLN